MLQKYDKAMIRLATLFIWEVGDMESAISIIRRLLFRNKRYPLYYFMLADCYASISQRDKDIKALDKSQFYLKQAHKQDKAFCNSQGFEEGIKLSACYLVNTQDYEKYRESTIQRINNSIDNGISSNGEVYNLLLELDLVSENSAERLLSIKNLLMLDKAGYNQNLYIFSPQGKLIETTWDSLVREKMKNPDKPFLLNVTDTDPVTREEKTYTFNILKHFRTVPPSLTVIKARQRRRRWYHNDENKQARLAYQKKYDAANREKKLVRNKLDYSLQKSGNSHQYARHEENTEIDL
jgi:hypothetical protein